MGEWTSYRVYNRSTLAKFKHFSIVYYGIYFSIGFLCFLLSYWFFSKIIGEDVNGSYFWVSSIGYSLSFVIGTKLLRIYKSREKFYSDPWATLKRNGNSFYGGVFGIVLAAYLMDGKYFTLPLLQHIDLIAISLPIFQIFIRLGCASYGCCFGRPSSGERGIRYCNTNAPAYKLHGDRPLLPAQSYSIYKDIFLLVLLYGIFFLAPFPGLSVVVWCVAYSLLRFVLDYTRDITNKKMRFGLLKSQQISILIFLIGIGFTVYVEDEPYTLDFSLALQEVMSINSVLALLFAFALFMLSFALSFVITKD
ncbi:MAG: prolipoprotein diacylglyceryl transferase [Colwellia sp.]